tara:strand:- start:714 stop:965 length:252 start_codon:yes stop_codon:yes gene_type:complete
MTVKEVIEMLKLLDSDAHLDLSSDEEGNQYGPVDESLAEGYLKGTKEKVYTLYPTFLDDALDRYEEKDVCNNYRGELQDLFYE